MTPLRTGSPESAWRFDFDDTCMASRLEGDKELVTLQPQHIGVLTTGGFRVSTPRVW
jgi:hypothetical protein